MGDTGTDEELSWPLADLVRERLGPGPFTAPDARAAGFAKNRLGDLIAVGAVERMLFGVYVPGGTVVDLEMQARAAALVLPKDGVVARRTASWIYGVDPRSPSERGDPIPIECIVPRGTTPVRRPGLQCFQADLEPDDVTDFAGLACTAPVRTTADLLRFVAPPMGLAIADAIAHSGLIAPADVQATLERWPGERYIERARRHAAWIEPRSESFGESWLRLRILDAGFPRPEAQVPVLDAYGNAVYRLDLGWRNLRKAVEYDGEEFHSGEDAQRADQIRNERLRREFGWDVTPVGRGEVLGRSMALERGVGELLGMQPMITRRHW